MRKYQWLIYALALAKFVFPFIVQDGIYEPHRDEFLYLAEGSHLAAGFMEVPPMLSIFAWLTHLFGDGFFWIKCWPSLFGALNFILVARIVVLLGGSWFAIVLGWLPFIFGAYARTHFLFQPGFLETFFWTLMAYSLIRYRETSASKYLYLLGIAAGLGMLSKYSTAFFIIALLAGLAIAGPRSIFRNRHFYFAFLLGFLIFLPNLVWQYLHHFPVMFHMNELRATQLKYISPASFLLDQLLMNLPSVFIWIAGLVFALFVQQGKRFRFIGIAYLAVIAILLAGHGKNYYSLPIYPTLLALGAFYLEQVTEFRRWPRIAIVAFPVIVGLMLTPILLPVWEPATLAAWYQRYHAQITGALKWEDQENHPLPQDFADMLSWKEMSTKMARAYATLDSSEKKKTLVFCDNYGQCGAVNFYGRKMGLPEAFSANASFLYWMPETFNYENLLLLTDDPDDFQKPFVKQFNSAILYDSVTNPFARERGDLIIILKGAQPAFREFFDKKLSDEKYRLLTGVSRYDSAR